jgi:8-oxo-dGTP pyrophosphatase MutT (NUDIX family)
MAPRTRQSWPAGFEPSRLRHAAGLLLLFPRDTLARIVLTERAHTLERHRGQISLPGGVIEAGETVQGAALREAHEEIGLDPSSVQPLGFLTPVDIPVSGFRLHPLLAACDQAPAFRPAEDEVGRILEVDIDRLLSADRVVWRTLVRGRAKIQFPAFPVDGAEVWGATAMVLAECLALLDWTGPAEAPA